MASRKERRELRGKRDETVTQMATAAPSRRSESALRRLYREHHNALLLFSTLLVVLAILQIGYQVATTGDFVHKGVSLRGGLILTVPVENDAVTPDGIQALLAREYPGDDIIVRGISEFGDLKAIEIEFAADVEDRAALQTLQNGLVDAVAASIPGAADRYSVEVTGPSLGASFFDQVLRAMGVAFILMGMVVFLSFGEKGWAKAVAVLLSILAAYLVFNAQAVWAWALVAVCIVALVYLYIVHSVPSSFVILAALCDILLTVAVVNLLGVKLSAAGIAAFLMLIGYSVDTDILLTTRVLKHKRGTVDDRIIDSAKTGMTMSFASMAAAGVGYLVGQSSTIKEIMLIIFIGLIADIIMTWIQNVSLLRIYLEKRGIQ